MKPLLFIGSGVLLGLSIIPLYIAILDGGFNFFSIVGLCGLFFALMNLIRGISGTDKKMSNIYFGKSMLISLLTFIPVILSGSLGIR